jgi:hypothetical protein
MTLESLLDTMEKLATRNHDRACQHLADTRLQCNCGTALHNAKVKGTAIRMGQMIKDGIVAVDAPKVRVEVSQGVVVPQPIPGSPALQQPVKAPIQQSPSVDIPTRTAGPAVEEPVMPPVQTPQEVRAMMESDAPSPAAPSTGTRPLDDIMPGVVIPPPPGPMEMHAAPATVAPAPPKRPVGHGPMSGAPAQKRMQRANA